MEEGKMLSKEKTTAKKYEGIKEKNHKKNISRRKYPQHKAPIFCLIYVNAHPEVSDRSHSLQCLKISIFSSEIPGCFPGSLAQDLGWEKLVRDLNIPNFNLLDLAHLRR